jgi:aminoglycoside phosphotransferase (APT) family kinase protein
MHAVDLIGPTGERRRVVLKRFDPLHTGQDVAHSCRRMWQTLAAVERLGLPAPRPIWSDAEDRIFGTAALVLAWVPGRVVWQPPDARVWAERMADALAAIHRAPLDGIDLGLLPRVDGQVDEEIAELEHDAAVLDRHPDGAGVRAALRRLRPSVYGGRPVLTHGDFHPGNVLWRRGRLEAVVDWDHAAVGDSGVDAGLCRLALALQHSPGAAADFLRAYEAAAGRPVPHLVFWDLLAAALAIRYFGLWVASMDAFGRRDLTAADLRRRLDAFIADALARR